jgi:ubiquinone/menaquinone biosynthesis C-methylase UbiE
MNPAGIHLNEQLAAAAFTRQSEVFDRLFSNNPIIQYKRKRVRDHLLPLLSPGSRILELNSGTGEDACWFARQGHFVHATDLSTGMQDMLREKVKTAGLEGKVSQELCSFTTLENLQQRGPYDLIFSNFAGLNCTGELDKTLRSFSGLLTPSGRIVLVVLPSFCLWETLLLFKGRFGVAFRRFFSKKGVTSNVEGISFTCWYYSPSYIIRTLKKEYDLTGLEGLCTLVPPSYMEDFTVKHARLYQWLQEKENRLKNKWPWKGIGDYYIISLKKKT